MTDPTKSEMAVALRHFAAAAYERRLAADERNARDLARAAYLGSLHKERAA